MTSPKYPTKEEVLASLYEPSREEMDAVKQWKIRAYQKRWKNLKKPPRLLALMELGDALCLAASLDKERWPGYLIGKKWAYLPETIEILMDRDNPSIISFLHELGHFLYGPSELRAQSFAVSIFKACFPKEYARLEWDGHMLKTKKVS